MRVALFFTVLGALAACGTTGGGNNGSGPTSTSVSGSAGGQSFAVKDAVGLYNANRHHGATPEGFRQPHGATRSPGSWGHPRGT
jgi:hypothetical protein